MTIYEDGVEQETVPIHTIKTKEAMHSIVKKKGFVIKLEKQQESTKVEARHKQQNNVLVSAGPRVFDERGRKNKERADRSNSGILLHGATEAGNDEERLRQREALNEESRVDGKKGGSESAPPPLSTPPYQTMISTYCLLGVAFISIVAYSKRRRRQSSRKKAICSSTDDLQK